MAGSGPVENNYGFTNPYGQSFFAIDGLCHFYASTDAHEGMVEGTLTDAEAEQMVRDLRLWLLPGWSGHYGRGCPDAGGANLITSSSTVSCVCGCDGAPDGATGAINKARQWLTDLVQRGAELNGPMRAAAAPPRTKLGRSTPVYDWSVTSSVSETSGLVFEPNYQDSPPEGARFDGADADALRELRSVANADLKRAHANQSYPPSPTVKDKTSVVYLLYLRDELPPAQATAIESFLRGMPR